MRGEDVHGDVNEEDVSGCLFASHGGLVEAAGLLLLLLLLLLLEVVLLEVLLLAVACKPQRAHTRTGMGERDLPKLLLSTNDNSFISNN